MSLHVDGVGRITPLPDQPAEPRIRPLPDGDPLEAMRRELAWLEAKVAFLRAKIAEAEQR